MTGWGQEGPYATMAGHDINYIALGGALAHFGRSGEPPVPPINMVGDFGGGGLFMAFGVVCALLEAKTSGQGQVVDAAMVDGTAVLMAMVHGMRAIGLWDLEKGRNIIDGGAHVYDAYETADGQYSSIGSIEPQFYAELLRLTGLEGEELPHQMDRDQWPALKERMAAIFKQKTRAEWCEIMEGTDVCFAPVLNLEEAAHHPHNVARQVFTEVGGVTQPAPAPRFSRTPGAISRPPSAPAADTDEALTDWGLSEAEIAKLRDANAIA
jgi:alpha-methylacyl-CoA racemase